MIIIQIEYYKRTTTEVALIDLDDLFTEKEQMAHAVLEAIEKRMFEYGFSILETLVTDIEPDKKVKASMNAIVEAKRLEIVARHEAESQKVRTVKDAEARKESTILDAQADAESKRLLGEGVAKQREAIVVGLRDSVSQFAEGVGINSKEAMAYVVITQHYDTLRDVAEKSQTATLFTPYGPGAVSGLQDQITQAMTGSNVAATNLTRASAPPKVLMK
jgi:regulator of protease activity HflC (stomatin/prohibitin superfamily)